MAAKAAAAKMPSPPPPESQSAPLPEPKPPLHGSLICYTGLSVNEREEINKKIIELGGKITVDLTEGTTHLLVKKIGTPKYKVAFGWCIPVLALEWLHFLHGEWSKGQRIDLKTAMENFAIGPLKGCSICVTGLSIEQRHEIEKETIRHGGKYTNDLLKHRTTHLICDMSVGEKYTSAIQWNIACVPKQWLVDTITRLELADVNQYSVPSPDQVKAANGKGASLRYKGQDRGDDLEDEALNIVQDNNYLELCHIYLCPSFSPALTTRFKKLIRAAGGIYITDYDPQSVTHVLVPSDILCPATVEIFGNEETITPFIVNQQWLRDSNREGKTLSESDYIVPFPSRTEDGQPKPRKFTGATTWTTDKLLKSDGATKFATLRSQSKSTTDSDSLSSSTTTYRNIADTSPATTPPKQKPPASPSNLSPQQIRNGLQTRTVSGILSDALVDLSMGGSTQSFLSSQFTPTAGGPSVEENEAQTLNIFLGLHITSHGCKAVKMIREQTIACGGVYFDETETPPTEAAVKTIVPLSMPLDKTKDLKGAVMTICWFERSLLEERVISRSDHFLYKPMKHIPVQGLEKLKISVSSTRMNEVEYRHIERAIKILGGVFLDKLHTTETDLLICDVPEGPKYEFMAKNRRPIVKMEWLKCCIEEGVVLPFEGFLLHDEQPDKIKSEDSIKSRTPSASNHGSNESLRSNSSTTVLSVGPTQQPIPSDTPLEGLIICIPNRVVGDVREMHDLIVAMGARLLTSYHSCATHFVHKGKATTEAKRDLRYAKRDNTFIVSPDWIYKCRESGIRVDERDYPETYDGKHLTLNTTTNSARTPQDRPPLAVLPKRSSSPSVRPGSNGKKRGTGRSASVGFQSHRPGSASASPSQAFQGTAARAMSAMFGGDSVSPTLNMSSVENSMELSSMDMQSMEPEGGVHSDSFSVWQPVPVLPVTRSISSRKRRRPAPAIEGGSSLPSGDLDTSAICETPDMTGDGTNIPEDYFDKSSDRYGEDAVYWVDVEGREKKRALMESLGYKTVKPTLSNSTSDGRLEALARELESQRNPRYFFLLTGITLVDRGSFKKTIQQLGGVVLEDINDDHDEWKEKCTHLITNGNNPPRTAKLVIARACQAMIVNKGFIIESAEKGEFVDETPYRVNV
ncbi:DNA topoisomerase 2-binding protein 1 [Entomortierella lignicola]|nr:DNA topoisomerase 2-binding protein 1 [Entomortierella lignicola]